MNSLWEMNIDTWTSKIRMKKITKYKRIFEWKPGIHIYTSLDVSLAYRFSYVVEFSYTKKIWMVIYNIS